MAAACAARATGHGTFRFTGGAGGLACSRTSIMFRTSAPSPERQDLRAVQEQGQTLTLASPVRLRTKSLSCRVSSLFSEVRGSRLPTTYRPPASSSSPFEVFVVGRNGCGGGGPWPSGRHEAE